MSPPADLTMTLSKPPSRASQLAGALTEVGEWEKLQKLQNELGAIKQKTDNDKETLLKGIEAGSVKNLTLEGVEDLSLRHADTLLKAAGRHASDATYTTQTRRKAKQDASRTLSLLKAYRADLVQVRKSVEEIKSVTCGLEAALGLPPNLSDKEKILGVLTNPANILNANTDREDSIAFSNLLTNFWSDALLSKSVSDTVNGTLASLEVEDRCSKKSKVGRESAEYLRDIEKEAKAIRAQCLSPTDVEELLHSFDDVRAQLTSPELAEAALDSHFRGILEESDVLTYTPFRDLPAIWNKVQVELDRRTSGVASWAVELPLQANPLAGDTSLGIPKRDLFTTEGMKTILARIQIGKHYPANTRKDAGFWQSVSETSKNLHKLGAEAHEIFRHLEGEEQPSGTEFKVKHQQWLAEQRPEWLQILTNAWRSTANIASESIVLARIELVGLAHPGAGDDASVFADLLQATFDRDEAQIQLIRTQLDDTKDTKGRKGEMLGHIRKAVEAETRAVTLRTSLAATEFETMYTLADFRSKIRQLEVERRTIKAAHADAETDATPCLSRTNSFILNTDDDTLCNGLITGTDTGSSSKSEQTTMTVTPPQPSQLKFNDNELEFQKGDVSSVNGKVYVRECTVTHHEMSGDAIRPIASIEDNAQSKGFCLDSAYSHKDHTLREEVDVAFLERLVRDEFLLKTAEGYFWTPSSWAQ